MGSMDLDILFTKFILTTFILVNLTGFGIHCPKLVIFSDALQSRAINEVLRLWVRTPIKSVFLPLE